MCRDPRRVRLAGECYAVVRGVDKRQVKLTVQLPRLIEFRVILPSPVERNVPGNSSFVEHSIPRTRIRLAIDPQQRRAAVL